MPLYHDMELSQVLTPQTISSPMQFFFSRKNAPHHTGPRYSPQWKPRAMSSYTPRPRRDRETGGSLHEQNQPPDQQQMHRSPRKLHFFRRQTAQMPNSVCRPRVCNESMGMLSVCNQIQEDPGEASLVCLLSAFRSRLAAVLFPATQRCLRPVGRRHSFLSCECSAL
jgi:hypothetical protein